MRKNWFCANSKAKLGIPFGILILFQVSSFSPFLFFPFLVLTLMGFCTFLASHKSVGNWKIFNLIINSYSKCLFGTFSSAALVPLMLMMCQQLENLLSLYLSSFLKRFWMLSKMFNRRMVGRIAKATLATIKAFSTTRLQFQPHFILPKEVWPQRQLSHREWKVRMRTSTSKYQSYVLEV